MNIENVVYVVLILEPCASVRDNSGGEELFTCFVVLHLVVNARRTHELRYDNTLSAVDDECAAVCHQRKIAHKYVILLDFSCFLVQKPCLNSERSGICSVALLTLDYAVVGVVNIELIIEKVKHKVSCVVGNTGHIAENLLEAFLQEPLVGLLLNFDKVRHIDDFIDFRKTHTFSLAELYGFNINHRLINSF